MSKYKLGYARVSTLDQDAALQLDALTAAGCDRVFETRPAASWRPVRPSTTCSSSSAPATRWWSGGWTASAARSATCWRPSPDSRSAG